MPSSGFRQPVSNLPDKKVISSLPFHSANYRIYTLIHYCPVKAGKSVFEIVET